MNVLRRAVDRVFRRVYPSQTPKEAPIATVTAITATAIPATENARPVEGDVDRLVREEFFADPAYKGIVIEVGAAKPDYLSISASFRELGWRVLAIEPNPRFCALHRQQGYDIIQYACGEDDADDVSFFIVNSAGEYLGQRVTNESFSSLGVRGKYAELMGTITQTTEEIKVKVRRLDTILQEKNIFEGDIDIISIDVEGWEIEVLKGLTFERYRPRVLIIENLFQEQDYVTFIENKGYRLWRRIEPNDLFVRADIVPSARACDE